jgi:hypothetical protein
MRRIGRKVVFPFSALYLILRPSVPTFVLPHGDPVFLAQVLFLYPFHPFLLLLLRTPLVLPLIDPLVVSLVHPLLPSVEPLFLLLRLPCPLVFLSS